MARKPKVVVLDSWATIAYLEDEAFAERVADIIADAHVVDTSSGRTVMIAASPDWPTLPVLHTPG